VLKGNVTDKSIKTHSRRECADLNVHRCIRLQLNGTRKGNRNGNRIGNRNGNRNGNPNRKPNRKPKKNTKNRYFVFFSKFLFMVLHIWYLQPTLRTHPQFHSHHLIIWQRLRANRQFCRRFRDGLHNRFSSDL